MISKNGYKIDVDRTGDDIIQSDLKKGDTLIFSY